MQVTPGRQFYTRNQILEAERYAWAGHAVNGEPEYFFDSISFWRHSAGGNDERVLAADVPAEGWWHRAKCNCQLCRGGAEEPSTGRRRKRKR